MAADQEVAAAVRPYLTHEDINGDRLVIPIAGHNDWEKDVYGISLPRSSTNGLRKDSFALWFYPMLLANERFQELVGAVEQHHLHTIFDAIEEVPRLLMPPRA